MVSPESGKETLSEPCHAGGAHALAFSLRGDAIASLGEDGYVRLWGLADRKQLGSWDQGTSFYERCQSLTFSASSGAVVFAGGKKVVQCDVRKGTKKEILTLSTETQAFAFSPDGETIAVRIYESHERKSVSLREVRSGKELFDLAEPTLDNLPRVAVSIGYEGGLAFSSDGRLLASAYWDRTIRLWNPRTGKLIDTLGKHDGLVYCLVFSPDDRFLVGCGSGMDITGGSRREGENHDPKDPVRVWHVGRRRQVGEFPCEKSAVSLAYSPAGDMLAAVSKGGVVQVWEAASGAELFRYQDGQDSLARAARFSPDGSVLATAMSDGTILGWGLRPVGWSAPRERLTGRELDRLWEELSGKAPEAYQAILTLAADKEAVTFLGKRLRRVEPETAEKIQQFIADLDADDFDKRQAASAALARLGEQAESVVRKESAKPRSAEVRKRLQPLMKALDSCFEADPAVLRDVRAIGVLRRIGTTAARQILAELAKGAPQATQTRTAKTALKAMEQTAR